MDWQNNRLNVKAFVKRTAHLYGSARIDLLDGRRIRMNLLLVFKLICCLDLSNFLPLEEHNWFLNFLAELKKMPQSIFDSDTFLQHTDGS